MLSPKQQCYISNSGSPNIEPQCFLKKISCTSCMYCSILVHSVVWRE